MGKVTGLGGVFYVVSDPEATRTWYREMLGIDGEYGPQLNWEAEPNPRPYSLVSPFRDNNYFKPGRGAFMINLRVDDLDSLIEELESKGVEVIDRVDEPYGKFAWILDPDSVKIELWEQCAPPPDPPAKDDA